MKPAEDSFCVSVATSLKNEIDLTSIVLVSVATPLKNETEVTSMVLVSVSISLKNEIVFPFSI